MKNKLDGATVTEAHRKLASDLCRNATGSNRALHHVPKFAQLIADSEARACAVAERSRDTYKDIAFEVAAERDQLRAEVEHYKFLHQCESDSSVEAYARAERAERTVEWLRLETARIGKNGAEEYIRAERAEAKLKSLVDSF